MLRISTDFSFPHESMIPFSNFLGMAMQSKGGEDWVWSHSDWKASKVTARYKNERDGRKKHTFLGLLAKIKCSICSYQFNI